MGGPALAPLPLTAAGFSLDTGAALRYKRCTYGMPRLIAWRGYGAADRAQAHSLAVSLCPVGLGAHPNGGPGLCAHSPRRTDTAPRSGGSIGSPPSRKNYYLPSAPIIELALQKATAAD